MAEVQSKTNDGAKGKIQRPSHTPASAQQLERLNDNICSGTNTPASHKIKQAQNSSKPV